MPENVVSPNPIFTALISAEPAGGYLRSLFGLGHLDELGPVAVAPDAILDPPPARELPARPQPRRDPVLTTALISSTPTGSINLKLRSQF